MLSISKSYLVNDKQKPVAVQMPIEDFEKLENLIENYGLSKLMDETKGDKPLNKKDALKYYRKLKK